MEAFLVEPVSSVKGKITLLGDKSIAHRCIILSSISPGKTTIKNFPSNQDCLRTLEAFVKLGVKIKARHGYSEIIVFGRGLHGLNKPANPVFMGDSGTTARLLLGFLAGQDFKVKLVGGKGLSRRPMLRVNLPLRMMGANITARCTSKEEYLPVTIGGSLLNPITYKMPVASAQVKSAVLLAGLYTKGVTYLIEPIKTRDHTERILKLFKARIKIKGDKISIEGRRELISPHAVYIPADISSAAFFIVMASILPNSRILIKDVSLNPSRTGIIKVLKRMGADINIKYQKSKIKNYEPMGDLIIKSSRLRGARVRKAEIPSLIDELPILMVAACFASGKTVLEGVGELRLKETDRIKSMLDNLNKMGACIRLSKANRSEDIIIQGVKRLKGARVKSFSDHRTAMSMVVAGMAAKGKTLIDDVSCIGKSFPNFLSLTKTLIQ